MSSSLKHKSFQGLTWSFIDNLSGNGISFIIGIVLARLLSPTDFGLVGMVTIIFAIANTIIESGFSSGLIRKLNCTDEEYSTTFFFNIAVSGTLYVLLYFSAPYIALFFNEQQLIHIIRILGLIILIDSFSIVQRVILIRNINFKRQTTISITATISSGVVGILMAIKGYGVWSLVAQVITRQTLNGLLLWISSKWSPSFFFSISIFKELFRFGSKLLASGLIVTIQNNIYYLVIGRFFAPASLGYYTRALQFNSVLSETLLGSFERVTFPVLSSIQADSVHLKSTLRKVLRSSFFISFLALTTLTVIAKPLILILIGPKWETSILYLQLICISTIFFSLNSININILKIKGRSDLILRLQIIKAILLLPNILAAILWGIPAMLAVSFFTSIISFLLNSQFASKQVGYSTLEQLTDITPYFISILIITIPMFCLSFINMNSYLLITSQLLIGGILFYKIFEKKKYTEYIEIKEMIFNRLIRKNKIE